MAAQAKHITTQMFVDAVIATRTGPSKWANLWDVAEHLGMPQKVVLAKAKKLIKQDVIRGCVCGCRGDFHLYEDREVIPDGTQPF